MKNNFARSLYYLFLFFPLAIIMVAKADSVKNQKEDISTVTAYMIEYTTETVFRTSAQQRWNNSPSRLLEYEDDMKDGSFRTSQDVIEYFLLENNGHQKLVRRIWGRIIPQDGFNQIVKAKANVRPSYEYSFFRINEDGTVQFPSHDFEIFEEDVESNAMQLSDLDVITNLVLFVPNTLDGVGDKEKITAKCLDGLILLDSSDTYEQTGEAVLRRTYIENGSALHEVHFHFSEMVKSKSFYKEENDSKNPKLNMSCEVDAVGIFNVSSANWVNLDGTLTKSDFYLEEGKSETSKFRVRGMESPPNQYISLAQAYRNNEANNFQVKIFDDYVQVGDDSIHKINNCDVNAPDFNERQCGINKQIMLELSEEYSEFKALFRQMEPLVQACACSRPEDLDSFFGDRLSKWQYLGCLKTCQDGLK